VGYRQQIIESAEHEHNVSSYHYYVLPNAWRDELTKGSDSKTIASEMAKRGPLIRGEKLQTKKRSPEGKSVRVYYLSPSILGTEE